MRVNGKDLSVKVWGNVKCITLTKGTVTCPYLWLTVELYTISVLQTQGTGKEKSMGKGKVRV